MQTTGIEYLTHTWNPIAMRCTPVSPGCVHCWHLSMADRLSHNPGLPARERWALSGNWPFVLRTGELDIPVGLRRPAVIGVQFMGDLFHENVPREWIGNVINVIERCPKHTFLMLTKRAKEMAEFFKYCSSQKQDVCNVGNLWLGVTICNQPEANDKVKYLLETPAAHRWVSYEPALGPVEFPLEWLSPFKEYDPNLNKTPRLDWVVLGGETGPGARPVHPEWVRSVRDQCQAAQVPFFFKGWGKHGPPFKERLGDIEPYPLDVVLDKFRRHIDGREWNQLPWKAKVS